MSNKHHMSTANEVVHIIQELKTLDDQTLKSIYGVERSAGIIGQFYDYSEDKMYESAEDFANWYVDIEVVNEYGDPLIDKYQDEGEFY